MEMDSEIQAVGWGEPVVYGSHVVGILSQQRGRACKAIPTPFIQKILEARREGTYRGLGYFHFYWQPAENTDSLGYLRLAGEPRGVMVINVPPRQDGVTNVLKTRDIILQIDGFDVDIAREIADKMGLKLEIVQVGSPDRIPFVSTGKIDMVLGAMTWTPERAKVIDFTVPVHTEVLGVLTTKAKPWTDWKQLDDPSVKLVQVRPSA